MYLLLLKANCLNLLKLKVMSVEYYDNEIVVRIPKKAYNNNVQKLIDALEKNNESDFFFDVEKDSELESVLKIMNKERSEAVKELLNKTKA